MREKHTILKTGLLLMGVMLALSTSAQKESIGEMFELAKMKSGMKNRRISSTDPTGGNRDHLEPFKPGEKRTIADIKGTGAINHIWITIAPPPNELSRNDIIIRMYWDGNEYPSVESPIGPFFGQGWDERYNYASLPLSVGPENGTGMSSYFTMPFEKGARVEIENQTGQTINAFYFYIDYLEMKQLPEDMGRFHAWYNHTLSEALPEGETEWALTGEQKPNTEEARNYVFIDTKGKGHFVGINYYVHSPTPMWYGEGDDMWFIDGEKSPSLIGTGTEDNTTDGGTTDVIVDLDDEEVPLAQSDQDKPTFNMVAIVSLAGISLAALLAVIVMIFRTKRLKSNEEA